MFAQFPPLETVLVEAGAVPLIFLGMLALGRWLKRSQGVRLGALYVLFSATLAIWVPHVFTGSMFTWRDMVVKHIGAATLLLGTLFIISLIRRYFWEGWFERTNKTKAPKFLSQLVALAIFLVAVLIVVGGIYEKSIQGAVFGSTVVLGVIGFAMQDLLGNIIAGVALEIGKPFKIGDWLVVDKKHAEVIEVNWRSTRLRDNDDVYFDIPNRHIVGTTIVNLTYPDREHAQRLLIGFDYTVPPNFVKDCLARATAQAVGVLAQPPPKVFLKDFADSAIMYEIKFWLNDETKYNDILDGIRTNVWYEAQRAGMRMPFPIRTIHMEKAKPMARQPLEAARTSVRKLPFLQLLDETQTDLLLANARLLRFGRGEKVIRQGEEGKSMFILLNGEAKVIVRANGQDTEVAKLKAGDYFGEMSLLTGEPRSATVLARTDCELWEIGKDIFAELLKENETLVGELSDLLAQRRMENEGHLANVHQAEAAEEKHRQYRATFLSKVTAFFEL